jgi:AcrR family transcriptional regulator
MGIRMKSGERRAAIVRAAIRLFSEHGFRGTTTRKLATALGVTEPVLYQHFPSKQDLYRAIIESKAEEVALHTGPLKELARGTDDRAFFCALGELILRRYEEDPELTRLVFFSALERHELAELFFEHLYVKLYRLVTGYIRRRTREGAFRPLNPDIAARGLIGMISYQGLVNILFPGRLRQPERRRVTTEMVAVFLEGICQRPDDPNPPAPRVDSANVLSTHSTAS